MAAWKRFSSGTSMARLLRMRAATTASIKQKTVYGFCQLAYVLLGTAAGRSFLEEHFDKKDKKYLRQKLGNSASLGYLHDQLFFRASLIPFSRYFPLLNFASGGKMLFTMKDNSRSGSRDPRIYPGAAFSALLVQKNGFGDGKAETEELTLDERIAKVQGDILEEQVRYQQRIFKLEKDNQELRRQIMLRQEGRDIKSRRLKRNPIEIYSEIVDDLADLHLTFGTQIMMPQILIVGDVNSGKKSLLEALLKTRIFSQSESKSQVPMKITMCEGPYHLAQFNDTEREFDLENGDDTNELRKELELRLKSAASTESGSPIVSLTVWGPGLSRMIVVDLPLQATVENNPAMNIPERVRKLCQTLLQSPQSLILCLIDATRESDYSKTVELVKDFDPDGRRSLFVLTKADLAETSLANPEKMRRIMDGSVFPLKSLGFYAAVPGRGPKCEPLDDVLAFEQAFFADSKLFQSGVFKPDQLSVQKLSKGISESFWLFVKNSLRYQMDFLKARKAALEKDWKNKFYKARVLDRDELYETARMQIFDDVIRLGSVTPSAWEHEFEERLWTAMADYVFEAIYVPTATGPKADLQVVGSLRLKSWAEGLLPVKCLDVASETLHQKFKLIAGRHKSAKDHDNIYDNFKQTVVDETFKVHQWDNRARENLRSSLLSTCESPYVITPDDWNIAVRFMEQACAERLADVQHKIRELLGPSSWARWILFRSQTTEHRNRRAVVDKLEKLIMPVGEELNHSQDLSKDEVNVIIKTLESQNMKVDGGFVRETWRYLFMSRFLEQAVNRVALCGEVSESDDTNAQLAVKGGCEDVELFYRVKRLIRVASVALRQQLTSAELGRLEGEVKQILDALERNPAMIKSYFNHPRIGLAEELKKISGIQEKLDDLLKLMEDEEPGCRRGGVSGDDSS